MLVKVLLKFIIDYLKRNMKYYDQSLDLPVVLVKAFGKLLLGNRTFAGLYPEIFLGYQFLKWFNFSLPVPWLPGD